MKKWLIVLIFSMGCPVYAQTDERQTLKQINENLISSYKNQKLDEAAKFAVQSVELSIKIYGADKVETAVAYTNLGVIYRDKRKYKESVENLRKAADIYQKTPNSKDARAISVYEALAFSLLLSGKKDEAEISYQQADAAAESRFGGQSKETFSTSLGLAIYYAREGKFEKADEFFLKAYATAIKNFGDKSTETESVGNSRSCIFYGRKAEDEKEKVFNDAVNKLFGRESNEKLGIINGKALSLPKPRYPAEARENRLSGIASVKVTINEQGNVIEAKSICREDILGVVAVESALKAKFEPTLKNGTPVQVTGTIVYNFIP